jgi:hypothetical protein
MEILGAIAAGLVVAAIAAGARFATNKVQARRVLRRNQSQGDLPAPEPPFPVRLTCREETEFHPSSGYSEGLVFEVFNTSDQPVTVRGFGLDVTMHDHAEWHEYEQARHFPPYSFPVRLEPHDALDGVIDTEAFGDELYERGVKEQFVEWRPYVDVAGYGIGNVEIDRPG